MLQTDLGIRLLVQQLSLSPLHETMAVIKHQEVFVDNMGIYLRVYNFGTTQLYFTYISLATLSMVITLLSQCITLQMQYCFFFLFFLM